MSIPLSHNIDDVFHDFNQPALILLVVFFYFLYYVQLIQIVNLICLCYSFTRNSY